MNGVKVLFGVGGILLAAVGITMVLMNPNQTDYEQFGEEQLSIYIKEEVCDKISEHIGTGFGLEQFLQQQCLAMVDVSKPGFRQLIQQNTKRSNYLFFSIYATDFELLSNLPDYHFQSVGVFNQFFIYKAEEDQTKTNIN